jgi:RND family efflux transporter MFP subunit
MTSVIGRLLMVMLALLGATCSRREPGKDNPPGDIPKAVRMATVKVSNVGEIGKYSAILTPDAQVDLCFRVTGYVVEIYQAAGPDGRVRLVEPGYPVRAGTMLARIRPSDYEATVDKARGTHSEAEAGTRAAEAQLAQAEAGLTQAELDFRRTSTLWEQESTTKPAYDASKAKLDAGRASVDAAKAAIAAAQQRASSADAQMREAQIAFGDTELRAPFDGILVERRVEIGSLAAPGAPAFVLADLRSIKARFNVPDFALAEFRPGQLLSLSIAAFPDDAFNGRIIALHPAADPKARSFEIQVAIPNRNLRLRSGMIASVSARRAETTELRVLVPLSALVHDPVGNQYVVYTTEQRAGQSVAKSLVVQPGPLNGNQIIVLAGLQPGQRIVVAGANLLRPGDAVQEVD